MVRRILLAVVLLNAGMLLQCLRVGYLTRAARDGAAVADGGAVANKVIVYDGVLSTTAVNRVCGGSWTDASPPSVTLWVDRGEGFAVISSSNMIRLAGGCIELDFRNDPTNGTRPFRLVVVG